jgi:glutamyl/glutaminyl-tRNA synthetase
LDSSVLFAWFLFKKIDSLSRFDRNMLATRLVPEASGFLQVGHVKAAMLSDYDRVQLKGWLILRFDEMMKRD